MGFKLKNHNIIFIHPPKCGGSSIAEALKKHNYIGSKLNKGAHKSIIGNSKLNFTSDEYFITVRNPYSRFYSYYHFCIEWDLKRANGEIKLKSDSKEFHLNRSKLLKEMKFDGFVNLLKDEKLLNKFIIKYKLKHAFKKQVDWYLNQTKKKVNVFKLEEGTVWKYLRKLGYNVEPIHEKKSTYKTQKGYTDEQAEIVYKYFKDDFDNLNYNKDDYARATTI